MSNIHIREKSIDNKTISCIFHFPVPMESNAVGIPWNEAVQKALLPTPLMADNDTTENAAITAGTVLEVAETVRFSKISLTNEEKLAEVNAAYAERQVGVFTDLAAKLDFFGLEV